MTTAEDRITGKRLNEEWNVWAEHALYSETGRWYHQLRHFPGAYFDSQGFILFETEADYRQCEFLQIGQDVNIPNGISSIPGYVLGNDEDEDVQYEGGSIYPYDMPEEVDINEDPHSVFDWMRKLKTNRLIIDPEFQRNRVWKPEQKSQFIESVMLNIPLIIVDGLQRTATLEEYVTEKRFALAGLKILKDLNGLRFDQLEPRFQAKIEDKKFLIYVIKPTVPLPMVYDIFHRINTGGTQLSRQEIRNCFHIGPATRFLKTLSEAQYFREAIDNGISPKRMKDREAVLRCLAFRIRDYKKHYKNDMDAFLGETLSRMNLTEQELPQLEGQFERVMKLTLDFWGERNFRLPTGGSRGRINIALMESVYFFFSAHKTPWLVNRKKKILENHKELLKDPLYLDAIQRSTGDTKRVFRRFEMAEEILGRS
jgi:hypothetical protein